MDVKRFSSIVFLLLIGALCLASANIDAQTYCSATVVWTDDFSDGDVSDWTVELGTFSVVDESLRGTETTNAISHASSTAYGTWTFDIEIVGLSAVYVSFLAGEISGGISTSCYCLSINRFDMELLESTNYQNTVLESYDPAENIAGWIHIEIIRDASGQFSVSINGTERLSATDTTHTSSSYFVFYCNVDCAIDNIELDEASETTPPNGTGTPPPSAIPGFPFVAIALGLLFSIALVVMNRRRNAGNSE